MVPQATFLFLFSLIYFFVVYQNIIVVNVDLIQCVDKTILCIFLFLDGSVGLIRFHVCDFVLISTLMMYRKKAMYF